LKPADKKKALIITGRGFLLLRIRIYGEEVSHLPSKQWSPVRYWLDAPEPATSGVGLRALDKRHQQKTMPWRLTPSKAWHPFPKFTVTPKPVITRKNTLICSVTTVRR
jgi:hypothetical protein